MSTPEQGRTLPLRCSISTAVRVLPALFLTAGLIAGEPVEDFKRFVSNPPNIESVKFWSHSTVARTGISESANFYRLYHCAWSPDAYVLRYYQKANGLNLEFGDPDFYHIQIASEFWNVTRAGTHYWYDNQDPTVDIHYTQKQSVIGDGRTLRIILNLGFCDEDISPVVWKGDSFKSESEDWKVAGQLETKTNLPHQVRVQLEDKKKRIKRDFRVVYDPELIGEGPVKVPKAYQIHRVHPDGKDILWGQVALLELKTKYEPLEKAVFELAAITNANYTASNGVNFTYTNNQVTYIDKDGNVRVMPKVPRDKANAWQPIIKRGLKVMFVLIVAAPLLVFWLSGRSKQKQVGKELNEAK